MPGEKQLKYQVQGKEVIVSGTCSNYPCSRNGWRCPSCVKNLEDAYKTIINGISSHYADEGRELIERRQQVEEMGTIIEIANQQMPVMQAKTAEAVTEADKIRRERDRLVLQIEDLEARLLLAGTETTQDRLRDCEAELTVVQEELLNTRHQLNKQKMLATEARKQQQLVALDLKNYRKYIKRAREREHSYREEVQKLSKRVHALGMEVAKKDDLSVALRNQIEELNNMAVEAMDKQIDIHNDNEGLLDTLTRKAAALERAHHSEESLRNKSKTTQEVAQKRQERVNQLHTLITFQRNETQSVKNQLARERTSRRRLQVEAEVQCKSNPQQRSPPT